MKRERKFKTFDQHLKRAENTAAGKIDFEDDLGDEILTDSEEGSFEDFEPNEQQKAFKDFLIEQAMEEERFDIDFDMVLDLLDASLPEIPGKPVVQQVNPPGPNRLPIRVEYGKLMPLKDDDGKKKKNA